jgi:hypothetical protein
LGINCSEKFAQRQKILPEWRSFADSGHPGCDSMKRIILKNDEMMAGA